jgi:hypothetical protein
MDRMLNTLHSILIITESPEVGWIVQAKHVAIEIKAPATETKESRHKKATKGEIGALEGVTATPIQASLLKLMLLQQGDGDRNRAA